MNFSFRNGGKKRRTIAIFPFEKVHAPGERKNQDKSCWKNLYTPENGQPGAGLRASDLGGHRNDPVSSKITSKPMRLMQNLRQGASFRLFKFSFKTQHNITQIIEREDYDCQKTRQLVTVSYVAYFYNSSLRINGLNTVNMI